MLLSGERGHVGCVGAAFAASKAKAKAKASRLKPLLLGAVVARGDFSAAQLRYIDVLRVLLRSGVAARFL